MLTFEKIRDIERAEREGATLQRLPENFIDDVGEYLHRKEGMPDKTDFDTREIDGVKNTIKRLLEIREHKILDMTRFSSRTGMPVENLAPWENSFFSDVVNSIKALRERFFNELDSGKQKVKEPDKKTLYKVLMTLPVFLGPDIKDYRLTENDIVELPEPLNELLLKKGVIEKIS